MGCGGAEEKKDGGVAVEEKSDAVIAIEKMIAKDKAGEWVWKLYSEWPVEGEPTEVALADGSKRKTWPKSWADMEALLGGELGLEKSFVDNIKAETVDNAELPHITEDCVTWPAIQNLVRRCWVGVNGEWKREEHDAEDKPYFGLLRTNTLQVKVEGLSKMLNEMGEDKFLEAMWGVYTGWPNAPGEEKEVTRTKISGEDAGSDVAKSTWPLPFEGDTSVTSLLDAQGWTDVQIAAVKVALFEKKDESGVHANCTEAEVCWPDLQQVFRSVVCEEEWSDEESKEWTALDPKATLREKIDKEHIKDILEGEWRMYCKAEGQEAFSYGLILTDVDVEAGTFSGSSRVEGKYAVEDGKITFNEQTHRVTINYTEVWPGAAGTRDALKARLKANSKFHCESTGGFTQKATHENKNLPEDPAERVGDGAKKGVAKYYKFDQDAAHD